LVDSFLVPALARLIGNTSNDPIARLNGATTAVVQPESPTLEAQVRAALSKIKDPETGRGLKKQIHAVEVSDSNIDVKVGLTSYANPIKNDFEKEIVETLQSEFSEQTVAVQIVEHQRPAQPQGQVGLTVKSVIAIAAGKGGVGKSTAATSLAIAMFTVQAFHT